MATEKQISANRRNAQKSTGPKTEQGKIRSRQNAYVHGLTAQTVIGLVENADEYADLEALILADYEPQTTIERVLVQRLASLFWRLRRAVAIETGLFQCKENINYAESIATNHSSDDSLEQLRMLLSYGKGGEPSPSFPEETKHTGTFNNQTGQPFIPPNIDSGPAISIDIKMLERIERYEVTLWRQTAQTILMLSSLQAGLKNYGRRSFRKYPPAWK